MRIEPEIDAATIVLLGSFNPKIFQPFWFARHGLVSDDEADSANISIVHPDITAFEVEPFTLRVERERFMLERKVAPLIMISDLAGRIFSDLLQHTPLRAVGINRLVHFDIGDIEKRDRIGEILAPRLPWGKWGEELSSGKGDQHGGMLSLTLIQRNVSDRPAGSIQARIEPSAKLGGGKTGIFMEINDHYEVKNMEKTNDPFEIIGIMRDRFDGSMRRAEGIIDQIMSLKP